MGRVAALRLSVALAAALLLGACNRAADAAAQGQGSPPPATPQASSSPVFQNWPLPAAGQPYAAIDGQRLWRYVKEKGDAAERYRDNGHPQFWGIIAGTSGDEEDAKWMLEQYKRIGLSETRIQPVNFFHPQWSGESWEVTTTADGKTVSLTSAQPAYATPSTDGKVLDLPAVYAGLGSEADFVGRDVRGKAVVLFKDGARGAGDAFRRAQDKGAAAIFSADPRGGNYSYQSYRMNTTIPTFNLGTQDGVTLRDAIAKAPAGAPPHIKVRLDAKWVPDQKSYLVWGTLPGATDETIYVIAHRDGWFHASGDNASGVATLLGLAEHFAKVPQAQRRRTMVFIGTDGHHANNPSGYGREWLAANKDTLFAKTALMINAEHPAEVLTHGGTTGWTEAITPLEWYAGGASRPQLTKIAVDAFREFGVPLWDKPSPNPPGGDIGPFVGFLPGVVIQSNDFTFFHTSGDSPDTISPAGLANATRAYARIVDEVNKLPLSDLQRPEVPRKPRIDFASCPGWVKDSAAACTENSERACAVTGPGCNP